EYAVYYRVWQDDHTAAQTLKTDALSIDQIGPGEWTQTGYIIESDDGATTDANSAQAVQNTSITAKKGERLNVRFHLDNAGSSKTDGDTPFAIFYDRSDGYWTKASTIPAKADPTSSEDCEGFDDTGGSATFFCERIIDGNSTTDYIDHSSFAIDPEGRPWLLSTSIWESTNTLGNNLIVAQFVGSGGNCDGFVDTGGSDAWNCEIVLDGDNSQDYQYHSSLAFDGSGTPWLLTTNYNESVNTQGNNLIVAKYVGSGGDCDGFDDTGGSDAWDCERVLDGDNSFDFINHSSLAFDGSGTPWLLTTNYNENVGSTQGNNLIVAKYVGSGGDCDGFDDTGGSDAWDCERVLDGDHVDDFYYYSSLAFDRSGTPWLATTNSNEFDGGVYGSNLVVAKYVGSSGDCDGWDDTGGSDAWDCEMVLDGDNGADFQQSASLAFDPSGDPWLTSYNYAENLNTQGNNLIVAKYVGSGGDCDGFDDTGGSDAWDCERVLDGDSNDDYRKQSSLAFDSSGIPWLLTTNYNESIGSTQGSNLIVAKYVGSGGDCDGFDDTGGSDAWDCERVLDGDSLGDYNYHSSLTFDHQGNPWIATTNYNESVNTTGSNLLVVRINRGGELTTTPSLAAASGDSLSESHADIDGPLPDATDRDDADCVTGGASWNNGMHFTAEEGSGLVVQAGATTTQCTEVSFTIDTSQALEGETYRLVLATKDNWRSDKGAWRGPASITQYATITIEADTDIRYSKDNLWGSGTDCNSFDQSGGSADWGCLSITDGDSASDAGYLSLAYDHNGIPWIAFADYETAAGGQGGASDGKGLSVAKYVGSGGNCDGFDDTGGSDAWECTRVTDGDNTFDAQYNSLAFDHNNTPWVAFGDVESLDGDLVVAKYVGSGGNCDGFDDTGGSDAWECTRVTDGDNSGDAEGINLAFDHAGNPIITYSDVETVAGGQGGAVNGRQVVVATYVGSGGNCDGRDEAGGSDAWECTQITDGDHNDDAEYIALAIEESGSPIIAFRDYETAAGGQGGASDGNGLSVARYVGSGGSCDGFDDTGGSDAWECTRVFDGDNATFDAEHLDIAVGQNDDIWVSMRDYETAAGGQGGSSDGSNLVALNHVGTGGNCDGFDDTGGSDAWECTRVTDGDSSSDIGSSTSIEIDSLGRPVIVSRDSESSQGNLFIARYENTAGQNCDGFDDTGGSDLWSCTQITDGDSSSDASSVSLKTSLSGQLWVSFNDIETNGNLAIAALHLPDVPLGSDYRGRLIPSGDLRYRIDDGRSPRSDDPGDCGATADSQGYCGVFDNQGNYDSITTTGNERPIYAGAVQFDINTQLPTFYWEGRSSLAPITGGIYLQVYRFGSTDAWETVASDTATADCNTADCALSGQPTGTTSEYFEADGTEYWIYFRVYQVSNGSSITFKVDKFAAQETTQRLRGGRVFENSVQKPLRTD
ncbi:MAG: hypothetical protein R3313_02725, partial [Candidatus Saccharimonadales bacterium]|nr:hypothetical protein [Candidatus Saccharimonadales bacterium]